MPELLRPDPPRSWAERVAAVRAAVDPARAAVAAGLVLLLAVGGWWLLRPARPPVEDRLPRAAPPGGTAAASTATGTGVSGALPPPPSVAPVEVVVQVAGAVNQPGVYHLPDGARVTDLIAAAGGPLVDADLQAMTLAGRLTDGQRVQVPHQGEVLPSVATGGAPQGSGPGAAGPIDLNAATVADLDALPGIGPTTARAIVAYRDAHGPFQQVDDLTEVQGIGPARLDALRELVKV
jgi:competence protein ComEA